VGTKLPDIQKEQKPQIEFPIQMVGITGERRLVHFCNKYLTGPTENPNTDAYCTISVCSDLPPSAKGTHMSRLVEAVGKHVQEVHPSIEDFARDLACTTFDALKDVGVRRTFAEASGEITIEKLAPSSHLPSQETLKVRSKSTFDGENSTCIIEIKVPILLVCPCAQELVKARAREELIAKNFCKDLVDVFCNSIPMASHNQRGYALISMDLPKHVEVDFRDIAEIVHSKLNQTYSVLKREDELDVVYNAHLNPTFVEDACRALAEGVSEFLAGKLSPEASIKIRVVSEESIHQHNAFAQIEMSLGQLESLVTNKNLNSVKPKSFS
jgi:GTP cyclohydrolase IV